MSVEILAAKPSILVPPGQGKSLWLGDLFITFKVTGQETNGAFAVMEDVIPPGAATPTHSHTHEDEHVYIASGDVLFQIGDTCFEASTGAFVTMPKGLVHYCKNIGTTPAVLLVTFAPAGIEAMFCAIGSPVLDGSNPPKPAPEALNGIVATCAQYGVTINPPTVRSLLGAL